MLRRNTRRTALDAVATYTAADPEGKSMVNWSLVGSGRRRLRSIDGGVLSFKKSPDYEKPLGGMEARSDT